MNLRLTNVQGNLTFNALVREATFTKELLCAGATQIRLANYSSPGVYAQAFSALSIGLERIGKLCVMLDHYIENNGQFPDAKYMKQEIGHKLEILKARATDISVKRTIGFKFLDELNHPIHLAILNVLHSYAEGDRYSNIDVLVGGIKQNDPISAWFRSVDTYIFENLVAERKKSLIRKNATVIDAMMSERGVVRHTAETGETIDRYFDASFRAGMFEAVAPFRQLYVLQIARYWVELLWELGTEAQGLAPEEIPFFGEIFGGFYNSDKFFKSRKNWNF